MIFSFEEESNYFEFVKSSKKASHGKHSPVLPTQHQLFEAGVKYMAAPVIFVDGEEEPILAQSWAFARPEDVNWNEFEMLYQIRHDILDCHTQNYIVRGVPR